MERREGKERVVPEKSRRDSDAWLHHLALEREEIERWNDDEHYATKHPASRKHIGLAVGLCETPKFDLKTFTGLKTLVIERGDYRIEVAVDRDWFRITNPSRTRSLQFGHDRRDMKPTWSRDEMRPYDGRLLVVDTLQKMIDDKKIMEV